MKEENKRAAVKECVCTHEFQDKQYGKQRRLMTATKNATNPYKCTVCDRRHN